MSAARSRRRPVAVLLLAALPGLLAGCYSYSPVDRRPPDAGGEVRLRLSPPAVRSVERQSPFDGDETLEGELVRVARDSLSLAVSRPARATFRAGGVVRDTVQLASTDVRSVERKSLEPGTTAALFAGTVAGAGAVMAVVLSTTGEGGGTVDGGDDGTNLRLRVPIP